MSGIWPGETQTGQTPTTTQVKRDFGAREVLRQSRIALDEQTGRSLTDDPVLAVVDRSLARFQSALSAFAWPQGTSAWFQSRLVTGSSETRGRLVAATLAANEATPETKMASSGLDAAQPAGLAAGDYAFDLTLGAVTERVGLSLSAKDTWGQVLNKAADAVNAADLPVRADVVRSVGAFAAGPDIAGTGSVLTFSVNALRPDQGLEAQDVSGGLLRALGMSAATEAVGPAQTGPYDVSVRALALPTLYAATPADPNAAAASAGITQGRHDLALTRDAADQATASYRSTTFDPGQATTLAAGTYTFSAASDGETRSHAVTVGSGWTWGDVLRAVGAEVNGQYAQVGEASPASVAPSSTFSQPGVSARVDTWPIPDPTRQDLTSPGRMLVVQGETGKGFTLRDGAGGLLAALGLNERLVGRTASYTVGAGDTVADVRQSLAVSVGDALGDGVATATLRTVVPSAAVAGLDLKTLATSQLLLQQNRRLGQTLELSGGAGSGLAESGLSTTAWPGQDGQVQVNGTALASENNAYSLDKGRLLLGVVEGAGEALPLRVSEGMAQLEESLGQVTGAYNDLLATLSRNADVVSPGVKAALEEPLAARAKALSGFGLNRLARSGQAWTDLDAFWKATYADTRKAQALFTDPDTGLIPAWRRAAQGVRQAGTEAWRKPRASFEGALPVLTSEFELERKNRLLDLLG